MPNSNNTRAKTKIMKDSDFFSANTKGDDDGDDDDDSIFIRKIQLIYHDQ